MGSTRTQENRRRIPLRRIREWPRRNQVVLTVTPKAPIPIPCTLLNAIQVLAATFHFGFILPLSAVISFLLPTFLCRLPVRDPRSNIVISAGDHIRVRRR